MIGTIFEQGQGLGNQLWVYCVGKAIAEHYKIEHVVFDPENFKGHHFLDLDISNSQSSTSLNSNFESDDWCVLNEECFWDEELKYFSTDYDVRVDNIVENTIIRGNFQSEQYFYGRPERIRAYIALKEEYVAKKLVDDDVCVIYIRGGEYKRHKNLILPDTYWTNAISNMRNHYGVSKFIGISDDDSYFKRVLPDIEILPGSEEQDFAALYQSKYAIIANSSWGYFPTKLAARAKDVIAPQHWGRFDNAFDRWASPSNLYAGWMWQDSMGNLKSYEDCLDLTVKTRSYYQKVFNVKTSVDAVDKNIRAYIPSSIRIFLKKILAKLFPRKFG